MFHVIKCLLLSNICKVIFNVLTLKRFNLINHHYFQLKKKLVASVFTEDVHIEQISFNGVCPDSKFWQNSGNVVLTHETSARLCGSSIAELG